jgi:hypothetical protein
MQDLKAFNLLGYSCKRLNLNSSLANVERVNGNEIMDLALELKKLQGKRLLTLYQKKPFEITQVSNNQIILKTSTEPQRPISLKEITLAWKHLEKHKKLTQSEIRDLGNSEVNPAYVVAILASLPGVMHSLGPINLWLKDTMQ